MVDATVHEFGGVDILVNCAGIPQHDPAELTPLETWDRVLDINLRGTFLCCQAAARVMLKKGGGVIINFSSIAGVVGVGRGANAYCASKGGVKRLDQAARLGVGGQRNSCKCHCPLPVPHARAQGGYG